MSTLTEIILCICAIGVVEELNRIKRYLYSRDQEDELCDATDDASSTGAWQINNSNGQTGPHKIRMYAD